MRQENASERLNAFIRGSPTIALLDRLTAFRSGMRPQVLPLMEAELRRRGVTAAAIAEHQAEVDATVIWQAPGLARRCRDCERPAVEVIWDWVRLWDRLPIWPAPFYYCADHCPTEQTETPDE
jgi:hypothetical protein